MRHAWISTSHPLHRRSRCDTCRPGSATVSTRLVQVRTADGVRAVGITRNGETHRIKDAASIYALAQRAIKAGLSLEGLIGRLGLAEPLNLAERLAQRQVLAPID